MVNIRENIIGTKITRTLPIILEGAFRKLSISNNKITIFNQNKYKVRTESTMCYALLGSIIYEIIIKFTKIVARRLLLLFWRCASEYIESNVQREVQRETVSLKW